MPNLGLSTFCGAALLLSSAVHADIYMHNPRGSNDRNCERNENRNNGDRLFDSQNNAAGGYACPRAVGTADNNLFETPKQMYYLEGSYIPIEWTNQHGCGPNGKLACDIIIQYMCEDTADPTQALRDGEYVGAPRDGVPRDADDAATERIPLDEESAVADNVESRRYGVHETLDFYQTCERRERNKGLFAADQNPNRNDATRTRQNPNGARRGLECPEERDYFPYWAPSPWRDIAILSSRAGAADGKEWLSPFCKYATSNSQNVKAVGYCEIPDDMTDAQQSLYNQRRWPNNEQECLDVEAEWVLREPLGGGPPECMQPEFTRVNHLGNPLQDDSIGQRNEEYRNVYKSAEEKAALEAFPDSASASRYLWKVPEIPEGTDPALYENCVIRIRYNVSTADYPAYEGDDDNDETTGGLPLSPTATITDEAVAGDPPPGWAAEQWKVFQMTPGLNASYNGDSSPVQHDPYVALGPNAFEFVSLAVNTNQYGRTFQDRSYNFAIKPRPADIKPDVNVFNVNVRGKRGNIVQVYPSVEYDFIPNGLSLQSGREGGASSSDFVHFQWTGSDYNPRRGPNDAEGGPRDPNDGANQNARADRSNLVELHGMARNYPMGGIKTAPTEPLLFMDKDDAADLTFFTEECCRGADCRGREKCPADLSRIKTMALLDQEYDLSLKGEACLSQEDLEAINNVQERETHSNNCAKINGKDHPYFDGGLQQVTASKGVFSFFSSRNNNFSNRDQTMGICVDIKGGECEFTKGLQKAKAKDPTPLADTEVAGVAVGAVMAGAAFALLGMKAYQSRSAPAYEPSKGGVAVPMKKMTKAKGSEWLRGETSAV